MSHELAGPLHVIKPLALEASEQGAVHTSLTAVPVMAPDQATPLLDRYLFSTFKAAFGGRVRFIVSGGAPLSSHVEEYLATTLCTPVLQVGWAFRMCSIVTLVHASPCCSCQVLSATRSSCCKGEGQCPPSATSREQVA